MDKSKKILGAGIVLAAIAAAGTYFLSGKRGEKNREKIAAWTLKMKGEVLEKMKDLKEMNKENFEAMVDEISVRYARAERVSAAEMKHLKTEVKNAWSHISKQLKKHS
ncbi:MAG: hypothetical protein A2234_07795 [Elusimicrobia bacterium RIFOXYA2_FULL_58_8]|nr:MAG: hypothetical protein A2234_07795 [Elusimicrobia bacterium RIFOXYA2_FULL_58_8]OGS14167.1 MAG: hypothetical protein A2285_07865 [Elusimicrobia bacterium RIFOXYA12_FULL_57_11]